VIPRWLCALQAEHSITSSAGDRLLIFSQHINFVLNVIAANLALDLKQTMRLASDML
jgi:hypothetical protein